MYSRLLQKEHLDTPEARKALVDAIIPTKEGMFHLVAGKGVMENDPDHTETSVTPAWRKTVLHMDGTVNIDEQDAEQWKKAQQEVETRMAKLRELTSDSGAYWNESDRNEPNWEQSYWGTANYQKLKAIKQKYDPTGMFRVWNGIGGLRPETEQSGLQNATF